MPQSTQNLPFLSRDKAFYRTLITIALPTAFQSLMSLLVSMVDNIMVSSLGETALSAVSVSNQFTALFIAMIMGLASGSSALIAQYWGKKDTGHIKEVFSLVFKICAVVSLAVAGIAYFFPATVLSLVTNEPEVIKAALLYLQIISVSYLFFGISNSMVCMLKYVEIVRITLYITICSLFTNISLNYVLIFGKLGFPALGIQGAAIATLTTRLLEALIVFAYALKIQKTFPLTFHDLFRRKGSMFKDYVQHGLPIAVGDAQWALIGLGKAAIVGRLGIGMIAAYNVTETLMSLGMIFTSALAGGACVVVGKSVGAKDYAKTRQYARTIQILFAVIGIATCTLIYLTRGFTTSLYSGLATDVRELAMQMIAIGAFTMIGTTYHASCFIGINRGAGDGRFVFKVDMICGWLIVLPTAYLAAFILRCPLPLVFLALRIDQCFKWIIAFFRLRGNRWIRNVTRDEEPHQ